MRLLSTLWGWEGLASRGVDFRRSVSLGGPHQHPPGLRSGRDRRNAGELRLRPLEELSGDPEQAGGDRTWTVGTPQGHPFWLEAEGQVGSDCCLENKKRARERSGASSYTQCASCE